MFQRCYNLTAFSSDLSNLKYGKDMFELCYNFTAFSSNLSNLTDGERMFKDCYNLTSFTSELPSLTNGHWMFLGCKRLPKFKGVLNSLTNADNMFDGCTSLKHIGDYPFDTINHGGLYANSLETAVEMFDECPNLETLHFDIGKINDINNLGLETCSKLKDVCMSLSSLTTVPTCFRGKTNLSWVNLNVSNLTSVD